MITITIHKKASYVVFKLEYENAKGRQEVFFQLDLPYFEKLLLAGNEVTLNLSHLDREELIRVANIVANEYEGAQVFDRHTQIGFVFAQEDKL